MAHTAPRTMIRTQGRRHAPRRSRRRRHPLVAAAMVLPLAVLLARRLRRLGGSGHTGVVRGRDAGALSGAPGPEERSGRGHPAHETPWGRGCGGRQRWPVQLGSCAGLRAFPRPRPCPAHRLRALRIRTPGRPRLVPPPTAPRTAQDRERMTTHARRCLADPVRAGGPGPRGARRPAPAARPPSPTAPTAPSSGTAHRREGARPRHRPGRPGRPAAVAAHLPGGSCCPRSRTTRGRTLHGRLVTFWPYGDARGPATTPTPPPGRPPRALLARLHRSTPRPPGPCPPMRGPAKAARALARLAAPPARDGPPSPRSARAWRRRSPPGPAPRPRCPHTHARSATATSTSASSSATPPRRPLAPHRRRRPRRRRPRLGPRPPRRLVRLRPARARDLGRVPRRLPGRRRPRRPADGDPWPALDVPPAPSPCRRPPRRRQGGRGRTARWTRSSRRSSTPVPEWRSCPAAVGAAVPRSRVKPTVAGQCLSWR